MSSVVEAGHGIPVEHDPEELRIEVLRTLERVQRDLTRSSCARAVGSTILSAFEDGLESIRMRAAGPLRVVVMGDFKRGKSTLINALLGRPLAPMDVLSETVTINEFSYHDCFRAHVRARGGLRVALNEPDLAAVNLTKIIATIESEVTHLDVRAPAAILKTMILVDTPGAGDMKVELEQQVRNYMSQADVIVVVVSPSSPLSQTEQLLLRTSVAPHEFSRICFVLNGIDALNGDSDVSRMSEHVRSKAHGLFPGAGVYALSALDELARATNAPRPRPGFEAALERRFETFRAELAQLVSAREEAIRLDRTLHLALRLLSAAEVQIQLLQSVLRDELSELEREVEHRKNLSSEADAWLAATKRAHAERVRELGDTATGWMSSFVRRLTSTLPQHLATASMDDIRRDFVFFLHDKLCEALGCCLDAQAEALNALADEAWAGKVDLGTVLDPIAQRQLSGVALRGGTGADTALAQGVISGAIGVAFGVPGIKGVLEHALDRMEARRSSTAYAQKVEASAGALEQMVSAAVSRVYASIALRFEESLSEAHQTRQQDLGKALNQAAQLKNQTEEASRVAADELESALNLLREARSKLAAISTRAAWSGPC